MRAREPDTTGKLAMHAYSYEHKELAAYELLQRIAERAGREPVRQTAWRIGEQERAVGDRIAPRGRGLAAPEERRGCGSDLV